MIKVMALAVSQVSADLVKYKLQLHHQKYTPTFGLHHDYSFYTGLSNFKSKDKPTGERTISIITCNIYKSTRKALWSSAYK